MKLGLLADHLHTALAAALRALLPGADVVSHDKHAALRDPALQRRLRAEFETCDIVVTQDVPHTGGPLATTVLRHDLPVCHLLPQFQFAGFHPDILELGLDGSRLVGPTGTLHSRIALLAYLTGHTPQEAAPLYNALVCARLGYFDAFARERAAVLRRFLAFRIDLAPALDAWTAAGCFMHAPDTPRPHVLMDLARLICRLSGCDVTEPVAFTPDLEASLAEPTRTRPTHPLYAAIAARLGVAGGGDFQPPQSGEGARLAFPPDVFLSASFDAFRHLPRAALLAAPGVQAGLAALGLPENDPALAAARKSASAAAPDAQCFITWHGAVLQVDAASGLVTQRDPRRETEAATDLLAPHALVLSEAPRPLALLGGITVRVGNLPGTAALCREGKYLTAEPHRLALRFIRDQIGNWESFLPIDRTALTALRTLLRAGWRMPNGEAIPRAAIRLAPGLRLHVGKHRVSLRDALPRLVSAAGEDPRIALPLGGTVVVLTIDPADPAGDVALDQVPAGAVPPLVGSPEEFAASVAARLELPQVRETIFPPITLTNAHRRAALAGDEPGTAHRIGNVHTGVTLWRGQDKTVLLAQGAEGLIADAAGIWKDHATLLGPGQEPHVTVAALLRAPPETIIEGPLCVFYHPNPWCEDAWLGAALPALHVLAPHLPHGARLLLPRAQAAAAYAALLPALGFTIPVLEVDSPAILARDVIFLTLHTAEGMPAPLLRSFRDRIRTLLKPPPQSPDSLYLPDSGGWPIANAADMARALRLRRFHILSPEEQSVTSRLSLFAGATDIVAPRGPAITALLACQPGTRLLEIVPEFQYDIETLRHAEKLELTYAALPCPVAEGALIVDLARLRSLQRIQRLSVTDVLPERREN